MTRALTVACIQNTAGNDVADNVRATSALIRQAADGGANLVCLPENVSCIEPDQKRQLATAFAEADHPALPAYRALARDLGIHLLVGSLTCRVDAGKVANRSFMLDDSGEILARYDKLHLFDVDLRGGEMYRESATVRPGDRAVLAPTPWGPLGMTICYDVRFPALYRALAQAGARFLAIPSAFTRTTGRAHWHVLVRARAIESGCFVFAPAQTGVHAGNRKTFGHSLIVDPWGEVLADGGEEVGIITARIDVDRVDECRRMVPSLRHDRPFAMPDMAKSADPSPEAAE